MNLCRYAVIRFTPDIIANERINIGVIVYDIEKDDDIRIRFLTKWDRVQAFANKDIQWLLDYVGRIQATKWTQADIAALLSANGYASVYVEGWGGSLESADKLFEWACNKFLMEA